MPENTSYQAFPDDDRPKGERQKIYEATNSTSVREDLDKLKKLAKDAGRPAAPFVATADLPEDFEEQLVVAAARQRFSPESGYYDKSTGVVQGALKNEARPYVRGVILWLEDRGYIPPQKQDIPLPKYENDERKIDLYSGELGRRVEPVLKKISEATVAQNVGLPSAPKPILESGLGKDHTEDSDSFTADADNAWMERDATDPDFGTPNYDAAKARNAADPVRSAEKIDREDIALAPDSMLHDDSNERDSDVAGWVTIKRGDFNELMSKARAKDAEEGR